MDIDKAIEVEFENALYWFIENHSVGLARYKDKNHPYPASGTLLEIGTHYFIATAAHCIKRFELSKIRIAYKRKKEYSRHFTLIKKGIVGGLDNDPLDVGYLEIDNSIVGHIPIEFVTLDKVITKYNISESNVYLSGFPNELIPKDDAQKRIYRFRPLVFNTREITDDTILNEIDANINIVLKYPKKGVLVENSKSHPLPDPDGLSGGGIWIYDSNLSNSIVGTHNVFLIGIQTSWRRHLRITIGNRIINLLRLIAQDYPDISDIIHQRFKSL